MKYVYMCKGSVNNANFNKIFLVYFIGKIVKEFIAEQKINYWPTPAESPDLNPIEMLWHELKCFLRRVVKPSNKDELVRGIQQFWDGVTPD